MLHADGSFSRSQYQLLLSSHTFTTSRRMLKLDITNLRLYEHVDFTHGTNADLKLLLENRLLQLKC